MNRSLKWTALKLKTGRPKGWRLDGPKSLDGQKSANLLMVKMGPIWKACTSNQFWNKQNLTNKNQLIKNVDWLTGFTFHPVALIGKLTVHFEANKLLTITIHGRLLSPNPTLEGPSTFYFDLPPLFSMLAIIMSQFLLSIYDRSFWPSISQIFDP